MPAAALCAVSSARVTTLVGIHLKRLDESSPLSLDAFNAVRLLQLVAPISTRFTAPLLAQPDLSREKFLSFPVLFAPHALLPLD
jgi:hypothetical protein